MKSFRKSNLFTTSIMMLLLFSTIVFVGCEQENFSNGIEYLEIDGDLENPLTLLNNENGAIYNKATKRIESKLLIKDGVINFDNIESDILKVSPEICAYAIMNLELVNDKILKGNLVARIDKAGRLEITPSMVDNIVRVKRSGSESSSGGQVNLNNMTGDEVVNFFMDLWNGNNDFCLDSIVYMDSINWEIGFGSAYYRRQGSIDGQSVQLNLVNRCYDDSSCDWNNWSGSRTTYGDDYYIIRNVYGNALVSLWYY